MSDVRAATVDEEQEVDLASAWQRLLPAARLVRVPDAGHMLPYEKPEAVLAAID